MKKLILLVLGLCVAGLAAWAVPREQEHKPVKIEIQNVFPVVDAIQVATVDAQVAIQVQTAGEHWRDMRSIVDAERPPEVALPGLSMRYRRSPNFVAITTLSKLNSPNTVLRASVKERRHLPDIL